MNPFVTAETYDVELVDPRDGHNWTAQLRTLNAGDRAAIQDETVIESVDESGERSRVPMGRLRMKTVQLAVVSWNLPLPPTEQTIATLHPAIFDQLYTAVRLGGAEERPPTEAQTESPSPEPTVDDAS
jgi:hypothetical protein